MTDAMGEKTWVLAEESMGSLLEEAVWDMAAELANLHEFG
jgi:hypothetical protein